eukprot:COSAG02_NODE_1372_length_13018_cov_5.358155_5_plen_168_part_00
MNSKLEAISVSRIRHLRVGSDTNMYYDPDGPSLPLSALTSSLHLGQQTVTVGQHKRNLQKRYQYIPVQLYMYRTCTAAFRCRLEMGKPEGDATASPSDHGRCTATRNPRLPPSYYTPSPRCPLAGAVTVTARSATPGTTHRHTRNVSSRRSNSHACGCIYAAGGLRR